jgi:hypothetical protein
MRSRPSAERAIFGSGVQRASVCHVLLALVGEEERWAATGPSPASRAAPPRQADADGARMLAACWALWEGCSTLTVDELLRLAPARLEAMGELLAAMARGPEAIDQWITRFRPRRAATSVGRAKLTR